MILGTGGTGFALSRVITDYFDLSQAGSNLIDVSVALGSGFLCNLILKLHINALNRRRNGAFQNLLDYVQQNNAEMLLERGDQEDDVYKAGGNLFSLIQN